MAKIKMENLRHSYTPSPKSEEDWALKQLDIDWEDGGAYALLGPSGCGKTTLLNIISGILKPSEGKILFDAKDVTAISTERRNIAQVFQFPVVYDTMTVHDNLAFPLRNRGVAETEVKSKVAEIAEMLELEDLLKKRAQSLTADVKQKISLGRGLVRADVNALLFDEPLTVIDPHLKWVLRSKLKELHQRVKTTMIYVTHDQTEALTFADQVVVMDHGRVVQIGTPVELFEKPQHTFVGHFIGSPGMNVLPCNMDNGKALFNGQTIATENSAEKSNGTNKLEIGIRPEFITFSTEGIEANVTKVSDTGRYRIVETKSADTTIRLLVGEEEEIPSGSTFLKFDQSKTRLYQDGWLI